MRQVLGVITNAGLDHYMFVVKTTPINCRPCNGLRYSSIRVTGGYCI